MESILTSIKKMLGITEEYEHFDSDLIIHINSVFMILTQLGVGPPSGFSIRDKSTTWKEFISDETKLQLVKSYMHMKVPLYIIALHWIALQSASNTSAWTTLKDSLRKFLQG